MGIFNSIHADLLCPETKTISANTEIQIKWQAWESRSLDVYHLGDHLDDILDEYNNAWIRTDYICNECSPHLGKYKGVPFIRTDDQKRHYVFVHIENANICEILTENEFVKQNVETFVDYL